MILALRLDKMTLKEPYRSDARRYSARAALALWIAVAVLVWLAIGVAIGYVAPRADRLLHAERGNFSRIAPAAVVPVAHGTILALPVR